VTSAFGFRVGIGDEATSIAADDAMKTVLDPPPPDSGLLLRSAFSERYVTMSAGGGSEDLDAEIAILARAARRYDVEWPSPRFQNESLPRLREHDATPRTKSYRELASKLFGANPLGRQVRADNVATLSKQQIVAFLRRTIAPQNAVLVVVGDVRPAQALAAVQREFLDWPATSARVELSAPLRPDWPQVAAARFVAPAVVARPGASQVQFHLGCLLPPSDPAIDAKYNIAADVVGAEMGFRLRTTLGASYGVRSGAHSLVGGTAYLWMETALGNDELSDAFETMRTFWDEIGNRRWTIKSVRSEQITRIRDNIFNFERSAQIAGDILGTWMMRWPLTSIEERASHIQAVRAGEVNQVLRGCADHLVVAMTGDPGVIRAAVGPGLR
jgi:zinc protease